MTLDELKQAGEAPEWLNCEGFSTLMGGYLLKGETPRQMYWRVANSVAKYLKKPELAQKFYTYIDNNWLCIASPIASNCGTERGLPISCYGLSVDDSLHKIYSSIHESAMLTKHGGGIGKYWGNLRQRGEAIGNENGISNGIIPWLEVEYATMQSTSQGGVRRGSGANYLPIESNEAEAFIDLKLSGKFPAASFHHAVTIGDDFMQSLKSGDMEKRKLWVQLLNARMRKGEPYLMFRDTANRMAPECYKANDLTIKTSQLCNEIYLFCDGDHTFVCCLSSLNVSRWDEWKDTDLVETATWFLDGVMSEFIDKAEGKPGFENALRFAKKSRALGLGQLGWHTLLQKKMIPFESFEAMQLNNEIAKTMYERSLSASKELAKEYGEVEWTKGFGLRNTHCLATAPTRNNSLISGGVSLGIEPIETNYFASKEAKGVFIRKNPQLEAILKEKGKDTFDTWESINSNRGSVRHLPFLSDREKSVFATALEIDQHAIIRQASQRQRWIDQGQSVNLFFPVPKEATQKQREALGNYIHSVHWSAWELGLKGLYYCHTESVLHGDSVFREDLECKSCEA